MEIHKKYTLYFIYVQRDVYDSKKILKLNIQIHRE